MERTCKKCGETKPIERFRKGRRVCRYCNQKEYRHSIAGMEAWKRHYIKHKEIIIAKTRARYKKHHLHDPEKQKKREKKRERKRIENLEDHYIITQLVPLIGLSRDKIRQHPELIENHRQQIKLKRLLKSKKNENIKTS